MPGLRKLTAASDAAFVTWAKGYYYGPMTTGRLELTVTNDRLYASPLLVPRAAIDQLGIRVHTAGDSGAVVRLGVYADAHGLPGALLLDAGTVAGDSAGAKTAAVSLAFTPGMVWLACVLQNNGETAAKLFGHNGITLGMGIATSANAGDGRMTAHYVDGVSGALPDPFPAIDGQVNDSPRVFVRAA